jgi:hypothetical protein
MGKKDEMKHLGSPDGIVNQENLSKGFCLLKIF